MSVIIQWLGHSCFRIESDGGVSILIDPYDDTIGYRIPDYSCDILLMTHDHYDHAAEQFVPTDHVTIKSAGEHDARGITFRAESFPHDPKGGQERGETLAIRFNIDGIEFAHLGDIGDIPSGAKLDFLRGVQCLMIPIGGVYTINAEQASSLVAELRPPYVFPMHFKTKFLNFQLGSIEDFLKGKSDIVRISGEKYTIEPDEIPTRPNIIVLDFD